MIVANAPRVSCSSINILKTPRRYLRQLGVSSVAQPIAVEDFPLRNEPVLGYTKGSKERRVLESALEQYSKDTVEVPIIIGGKEYKSDKVMYQPMPFNHKKKIAKFYYATADQINLAIDSAIKARAEWERVPWQERFDIWLKAADLMAGPWRQRLNATTMLGQAKTVIQAEIDSAAELVDFLRINAFFAKEALKYQPHSPNPEVTKNSWRLRGLEGFVAAVSPFNFTAIGGNLSYTPALMGCGVLWKPSDTALLSNYVIQQIMKEAGVPPGLVNFVPADGPVFGDTITASKDLAAIHFTGSVPTFSRLWDQVGKNLSKYKNFPRLIGECGGKNFHFVHPTADVQSVIMGTIRSAFEFCGQKCSACSRFYVPQSLWPKIRDGIVETMKEMKVGPPTDFSTFTSAVIDEKAFDRIAMYIEHGKKTGKVLQGGTYSKETGYYVQPTFIEVSDPKNKLMVEEIFGPVLTAYVYPDNQVEQTLTLIDESTPYALTGAVFALDQEFLKHVNERLRYATGNFYLNDKSTGSIVGQQPFGGARMSGTNDKAGGPHNVLRWASPQSLKETFVQTTEYRYEYMD